MKIISFNINSLRARPHQIEAIVDAHSPDVIALQETKVDDPDFPHEIVESIGYHAVFHGQKGHYGVATLSKEAPVSFEKGYPGDEAHAQRRAIITEHKGKKENVFVFNGYFPQGENRDHPTKFPAKQKFYQDLNKYLTKSKLNKNWAVVGDMNISFKDQDIGIGAPNAKRWLKTGKCSFLPEEREWLQALVDKGFGDTFRKHYPEVEDRFSWFDYRSKGFADDPKRGLRIDLILATMGLYDKCTDAGIDYDIRGMEKPSDHAPIWAEFDI
ncbi:exodeoxyribonuclease III [Aliikangiella coralliicola]|uniref:Exodeoxyribonuclease III n=1 Tax=Aliikangiella coralliicola TaxID=2592383 RepID=A0A545U0E9_9GAMM|nr:exodeoxyribonuclease III [Aliikangiella coralliicola]TQV82939.1 exodeoxyribonuclease III [Aliikangiella coralliicola]